MTRALKWNSLSLDLRQLKLQILNMEKGKCGKAFSFFEFRENVFIALKDKKNPAGLDKGRLS